MIIFLVFRDEFLLSVYKALFEKRHIFYHLSLLEMAYTHYTPMDHKYRDRIIGISILILGILIIVPTTCYLLQTRYKSVPSEVHLEKEIVEKYSTREPGVGPFIARNRTGIWFQYPIRRYGTTVYDDYELEQLLKGISKKFSTVLIDPLPVLEKSPDKASDQQHFHVPSIVAQLNKDDWIRTKMEVVTSFDTRRGRLEGTSFRNAKFMADAANEIYPGTVKTLLLNELDAPGNSEFILDTLESARKELDKSDGNPNKYKLANSIQIKDCFNKFFYLSVTSDVSSYLDYVDTLFVHTSYSSYKAFVREKRAFSQHKPKKQKPKMAVMDPEAVHENLIGDLKLCEEAVQSSKPSVKIVPVITCENYWFSDLQQKFRNFKKCLALVNKWAEEEKRNVIITLEGAFGENGWWKPVSIFQNNPSYFHFFEIR